MELVLAFRSPKAQHPVLCGSQLKKHFLIVLLTVGEPAPLVDLPEDMDSGICLDARRFTVIEDNYNIKQIFFLQIFSLLF